MVASVNDIHTQTLCVLLAQLPGIEQRDRRVAASIQFQVGDKCQVRIAEGQMYRGEVSQLDATPGCHMVSVGGGGGCGGGGEGKGRGLGGVDGVGVNGAKLVGVSL